MSIFRNPLAYNAKSQYLEVLDNAFKSAYTDLEKCIKDFSKKTENAMTAFSLVYESERQYFIVKETLHQVLQKLTSNIEICAFNTAYQDKNREYQDSVLAMTRDDLPNAIAFYKSFFETENTPMEDKGSILIHETAHLAGLKSDKETKALNSAEALRNFLLLCLEKVSPDELFQTKDEANADENTTPTKIPTRAGEHLYNPDQPRVPAGSSTGGQWTSDGSNGGSSTDDEDSDSNNSNSESEENTKDSENENKTQETEKEKELRESNDQIYDELKKGVRLILEDEGMSDEEIEETLDGITLDEITEITDRASDKLKAEIEETLEISYDNLLASTDDDMVYAAIERQRNSQKESSNNANEGENNYNWDYKNPSGSVCVKKDENSSISNFEIIKDANGESKKVLFGDSDKTNPQNIDSNSIDDVKFTSSPEEGIMINRAFDATGEAGLWCGTSMKFEGFEPKEPVTLLFNAKCTCIKNGEPYEEEVTVAYDMIADDKGRIVSERVHILNTLEQKGISLSDVNIELEASYLTGSIADNGLVNSAYTGKENSYQSDNNETLNVADKGNPNKDKTMLFFSMTQHARIGSYDRNKNIQSYGKNNGGAIDAYLNEEPTPIFKSNIYIKK